MKIKWKRKPLLRKSRMRSVRKLSFFGAVILLTAMVSACDGTAKDERMTLEELLTAPAEDGSRETMVDRNGDGERNVTQENVIQETGEEESKEKGGRTLWIHICGEVAVPGIYEFEEGCRLYDALVAAGGFTKDADTTYYNLVDFLEDGMQIEIPRKADAGAENLHEADSGKNAAGQTWEEGLVNINTASVEELQRLPGIGESRAVAIIEYRQKCGGFTEISQIMEVSGIKEAIFAKIKDLIRVR